MARKKPKKKIYYKIGEACKQLDIQPYVLRYWETEFPSLSPDKSRSGQRVYSERELTLIRRIQQLLYDEGYTIAGAKKKLEAEAAAGAIEDAVEAAESGESLTLDPAEVQEKVEAAKQEAAEKAAARAAKEAESQVKDRLQAYRQGIEEALEEARDLLSWLDAKAS